MSRIPWSKEEDEQLERWYREANGAFHTYKFMAASLNKEFHQGKPVRNISSIRRREGKVVWNNG